MFFVLRENLRELAGEASCSQEAGLSGQRGERERERESERERGAEEQEAADEIARCKVRSHLGYFFAVIKRTLLSGEVIPSTQGPLARSHNIISLPLSTARSPRRQQGCFFCFFFLN